MNYKKKRIFFIATTFFISILSLVFILNNLRDNIVFFYSPSELDKIKSFSKEIRVGGLVKKNSIKKIDAMNVEFVITDFKDEIKIYHKGIIPDLFRENQGVVLRGFLNEKDKSIFLSKEMLIKHDEKYVPPEISSKMKIDLQEKN